MGNIPPVVSGQLATAAQYNALQSGLNPLVENSYTSWVLKSGFPLTVDVATSGNYNNASSMPTVDEINDILYLDIGSQFPMVIVDIANATPIASGATALNSTGTTTADATFEVIPGAPQFSRNVRYYTWIDASNNIHIYKAGLSLAAIALPNPPFVPNTGAFGKGYSLGPFMSPTGKYIITWPYNGDTGYTIDLYVYEGQP